MKNKDVIDKRNKTYYSKNKETVIKQGKAYYLENKEAKIARGVRYVKNRRKTDPFYALCERIRTLIGAAIRNQGYTKKTKTHEILGCSFEEFKAHIESLFPEGMGWHNRSEWHLDHIYPVSKATDEAHLIKLNHYTNFQPLWAEDNMRKGNKIPEEPFGAC